MAGAAAIEGQHQIVPAAEIFTFRQVIIKAHAVAVIDHQKGFWGMLRVREEKATQSVTLIAGKGDRLPAPARMQLRKIWEVVAAALK